MEDSDDMDLLCYQNMPCGLEILTAFGRSIVESFRIDEILLYSSFKTIKKCLELFALIMSCTEVRISFANFALEPGPTGEYGS